MATETNTTAYRGLIVADERATLWAAESSYTQADPVAGVPVAQNSGAMALTASGTQTAANTLEVRTITGGIVATDDGARYIWRNSTDAATDWRGWDPPVALSGIEAIRWTDGSGALKYALQPHAINVGGTVLAVHETRDTSRAAPYGVEVAIRNQTTGAWSTVEVWTTTLTIPADQQRAPCLVELPSGRILCYFWIFDPNLSSAQIRQYYSDDTGATWTLGSSGVLADWVEYGTTGNTYRVKRIRAAYADGQIMLVAAVYANHAAATYPDTLIHWASVDLGSHFSLVAEWRATDTIGAGAVDLVVSRGVFLLVFVAVKSGVYGSNLACMRLGSAYQGSAAATILAVDFSNWGSHTGTAFNYAELATVVDSTGRIYCYGLGLGTRDGITVSSADSGATWTLLGQGSAGHTTWYAGNDPAGQTFPTALTAAHTDGRIVIISNHVAAPGNEDNSLTALYLGGYTSLCLPGYSRAMREDNRIGWEHTWIPYDTPDATEWTGGGAAATIAAGAMTIATTGPPQGYTNVAAATATKGLICFIRMACISGGSLGTNKTGISLFVDDGSAGYKVDLRLSNAGFRIYDFNGSANIIDVAVDMTAPIDFMIGMDFGSVSVWYRAIGSGADLGDRVWTKATSTTITGAGTGVGNGVSFGNRAAGTVTSRWHTVCFVSGVYSGHGLATAPTNPEDLMGRLYSNTGGYVAQGVTLAATGGATVRGDEWNISTHYGHSIDRALVATRRLSPRIAWRSTDTTEQKLAFKLSTAGNITAGGDVIGIGLYGTNIPEYTLHGYDADTSAWVSIGTAKSYTRAQGLRWTRSGSTVTPDTGGASTVEPYYSDHELAGGYINLAFRTGRRIVTNSGGKWTNATTRRPVLQLDGLDGTEPASGIAGQIVPANWTTLWHLNGAKYSGYRITIPEPTATTPSPPETYWQIGALVIGEVVIHADQISWGRSVETSPGAELHTARDGTRRSRVVAPPRRVVEYGWQTGIDTTTAEATDGTADPDFGTLSELATASAQFTLRDTPRQIDGLIRRLDGAAKPLVYLSRIERLTGATAVQVIERRHWQVFGRMTSPVALESVQGDEHETEIWRLASIVIEEEI